MKRCLAIILLTVTSTWSISSAAGGDFKPVPFNFSLTRGEGMRRVIVPSDVTAHKDLPYVPNAHPHQRLDLYVPDAAPRTLPLLMWVHGGGWIGGDKTRIPVMFLAEHGYALASVDYRLSSDAPFPAQIQDVYAAFAWLWAHADEYGLDRNRFVVGGSSAGGHLASLMATALNADVEGFGAPKDVRIRAVLDYFAPSDLIALHIAVVGEGNRDAPTFDTKLLGAEVLDRPDLAKAASPTTYIDRADPPFLILHGDRDRLVPFTQSRLLASSLKVAGVRADLVPIKGAGHGGARFQSEEVNHTVLNFLQDVLAAP